MAVKSGYVSIVGRPNAGKSTLMNAFLDFKLSAVSRKVQTTRNKIQGILTGNDHQIIFVDTPGVLEPKYEMQQYMKKEIKTSFKDTDLVLYLIDGANIVMKDLQKIEKDYKKDFDRQKRIIVLNKCDRLSEEQIFDKIATLKQELGVKDIITVSAVTKLNLDILKNVIIENLPEGEFYYDNETLTDKPEKFFVSEIIREKILELYEEEIPYSVHVEVREFKVRDENQKDYINADIILERETQKIIVLGKRGEMIKKLGELARTDIEAFVGKEVYLKLFVKVRKDWRKDHRFLKNIF
ncbi:MAG: GTPase Era [Ignavibacteriae bacterium]|nr:GTPase Era [Ignavibacteriota bacterium]